MEPIMLTVIAIAWFLTKGKVDGKAYDNGKEPPNVAKARMRHEAGGGGFSASGKPKGPGALRYAAASRWAHMADAVRQRGDHKASRRRAWYAETAPHRDEKWRQRQLRRLERSEQGLRRWAGRRGLVDVRDAQRRGLVDVSAARKRADEEAAYAERDRRTAGAPTTNTANTDPAANQPTGTTPPNGAAAPSQGTTTGPTAATPPATPAPAGQPGASTNPATTGPTSPGGTTPNNKTTTAENEAARKADQQLAREWAEAQKAAENPIELPPDAKLNNLGLYVRTCAIPVPDGTGSTRPCGREYPAASNGVIQTQCGWQHPRVDTDSAAPTASNDNTPESTTGTTPETTPPASDTNGAQQQEGPSTVYQQAVTRLIADADQVAEYRADLAAFADTLAGRKWGVEVTGPIQDMDGQLVALEGIYRDLAGQVQSQGDQGAAAYDAAPWVPGPEAVLV